MKRFFSRINRGMAELCGWLVSLVAILLIVDVISRALFKPLQEVASIAVFVMIAVIYLGLPNCEEEDGHVNVDSFERLFPEKLKKLNSVISYLVQLTILAVVCYFVVKDAINAFIINDVITGTILLPFWPSKFAMAIGLVLFWIQILINFLSKHDIRCKNKLKQSPTEKG